MASDIVYTNCSWEAPNEIRAFLDNKTLISWALTHIQLEGNWIILRPFNCSKPELKVLSDALADMAPLKFDFQGALTVFFHLKNHLRFSPEQVAELDAIIADKAENMEALLRSYFPESTGLSIYRVFTQWANLGFKSWIFFRDKCH